MIAACELRACCGGTGSVSDLSLGTRWHWVFRKTRAAEAQVAHAPRTATRAIITAAWLRWRASLPSSKMLGLMGNVLDLPTLLAERARLRAAGKRVVFTNGCFDLLHPGHVRYLQQARALGDALIVALNSDRSVRELKGASRPILKEAERAEVMAALACVNYVTVFDEATPQALIAALVPDILVKGGDWSVEDIVGREEVEAAGGQVMSLPFVDGVSTSEVIERILQIAKQG